MLLWKMCAYKAVQTYLYLYDANYSPMLSNSNGEYYYLDNFTYGNFVSTSLYNMK